MGDIKVVDGLDKTNAAYLKKIIGVFAAAAEFLYDRQHQTKIAFDQKLPRF